MNIKMESAMMHCMPMLVAVALIVLIVWLKPACLVDKTMMGPQLDPLRLSLAALAVVALVCMGQRMMGGDSHDLLML